MIFIPNVLITHIWGSHSERRCFFPQSLQYNTKSAELRRYQRVQEAPITLQRHQQDINPAARCLSHCRTPAPCGFWIWQFGQRRAQKLTLFFLTQEQIRLRPVLFLMTHHTPENVLVDMDVPSWRRWTRAQIQPEWAAGTVSFHQQWQRHERKEKKKKSSQEGWAERSGLWSAPARPLPLFGVCPAHLLPLSSAKQVKRIHSLCFPTGHTVSEVWLCYSFTPAEHFGDFFFVSYPVTVFFKLVVIQVSVIFSHYYLRRTRRYSNFTITF